MRTFFVFLFLALFFIITLPAYLVLYFLRKKNRLLASKIAQKIVQWGFRFVTFPAGIKKVVLGLDAKIRLESPNTLQRFEGKAKRIKDLRNKQ